MMDRTELESARLSRERVKAGYYNEFYDQQAKCLAQWTREKPPEGLIIGDLPCLNRGRIRLDREGELEG